MRHVHVTQRVACCVQMSIARVLHSRHKEETRRQVRGWPRQANVWGALSSCLWATANVTQQQSHFHNAHSLWTQSLSNLVQKGRSHVLKQDPHKQDMMWLTWWAPMSPIWEKRDRDCPFKTCGWPALFPVSSTPLCNSTSSNCPSRGGRSNCR